MMRVLYIQHAGALGGSAVSLRNMAIGVRERGWDCQIALARPVDELARYYESYGFETIAAPELICWDHSTVAPRKLTNVRHVADLMRVGRRWNIGKAAALRLVEAVQPDIVHLNSMPLSNAALALTEASVPFVWHVREPPPDQGYRTQAIRRIMRQSPMCVFICEHDRDSWLAGPGGRIVYNSVPDDWFAERDVSPAAQPESHTFLFAGGMARIKGAEVLLQACERLAAKRDDWVCVMPGALGEAERPSFRASAKALVGRFGIRPASVRLLQGFRRLGDRVRLLPFQRDMRPLLEAAEFVLFPAIVPHFARPIIEAAAVGVPAIGSDLGGVRECIDDRVTGLLWKPSDPAALCAAMEQLLDDPTYRSELGQHAAVRARERYTVGRQIDTVTAIYAEVLSGAGHSPAARAGGICGNGPAAVLR
jgi:glycosyltransferase involved in cell wall biosynthesis